MVPGLILLAAGVAGKRFSEFRSVLAGVSLIAISALVVTNRPYHSRVYTKQAEQQLILLQRLGISGIQRCCDERSPSITVGLLHTSTIRICSGLEDPSRALETKRVAGEQRAFLGLR